MLISEVKVYLPFALMLIYFMRVVPFIIYRICINWTFHRVVFMVHCVGWIVSMSFSPPIWYHQVHIYFLDVFARGLFRGMGQPTFPFGLVAERFVRNLYAITRLLLSLFSFFCHLKFVPFSGAQVASRTTCFHQLLVVS